jgi:hypothetical protein
MEMQLTLVVSTHNKSPSNLLIVSLINAVARSLAQTLLEHELQFVLILVI